MKKSVPLQDIPHSAELFQRVFDAGQGHIFTWWSELAEEEKLVLLKQINTIDFSLLEKVTQEYSKIDIAKNDAHLKPAKGITLRGNALQSSDELGARAIKDGKVCSLVLAGGQGTRLGFNFPKGMYPIGPVSGKSLFEVFADKIKIVSKRYGGSHAIRWYIMTSDATDLETKYFFEKNNFFGLEGSVFFFKQGSLPSIDFLGKLIMDSKYHIFENPDGHGGLLKGLGKNGILDDMTQQGIEYIFIHNVDNPLTKVCNPVFIGSHIGTKADFSCLSILKQSQDEHLGSIVEEGGKLRILEYTDIPKYSVGVKNEKKRLIFRNGNTNTYIINVNFLKRLYEENNFLPIHLTRKKIPTMDSSGNLYHPQESNGITLETKIFDILKYTERSNMFIGKRTDEFSPLKNKEGLDSYTSLLQSMNKLFAKWIDAVGIHISREMVSKIEISPTFAIDLSTFKEKVKLIGRSKLKNLIEEQIENSGTIFLS